MNGLADELNEHDRFVLKDAVLSWYRSSTVCTYSKKKTVAD